MFPNGVVGTPIDEELLGKCPEFKMYISVAAFRGNTEFIADAIVDLAVKLLYPGIAIAEINPIKAITINISTKEKPFVISYIHLNL